MRALMPRRSPLGETVPYRDRQAGEVQRTIVGVVDDAVFDSQREGIQPIVYLPVAQSTESERRGLTEISVGVRPAAGSPMQLARSVGDAMTSVDPEPFVHIPVCCRTTWTRRSGRSGSWRCSLECSEGWRC